MRDRPGLLPDLARLQARPVLQLGLVGEECMREAVHLDNVLARIQSERDAILGEVQGSVGTGCGREGTELREVAAESRGGVEFVQQ